MSQNLLQWTVADVASYFSAAGFPEQAVAFRAQVRAPPRRLQQRALKDVFISRVFATLRRRSGCGTARD